MSEYDLSGLPKDLLSSKIEGERALKVSISETAESLKTLALAFIELESINHKMLIELQLLNLRFEEAFNTKIKGTDL